MRTLIAVLSVVLFSGCAETIWRKPGGGQEAFYRESGECSARASSVSNPYPGQWDRVYRACMRGAGWYPQ